MPSKVEKMRDSLRLAIEQVKSGALSPDKAKAMASLAHQVTASLDVELRVLIAAKAQPGLARLAQSEQETVSTATGTLQKSEGVMRHTLAG